MVQLLIISYIITTLLVISFTISISDRLSDGIADGLLWPLDVLLAIWKGIIRRFK